MLKFDFANPVTRLSGNEFLPKPGLTFVQQILEYFQSFDCEAQSPWVEVLLDKKGIQSDKSHGIGRIKAASFATIKDVLEKGTIILPLDYYATNGKKQMTGMMAAPIVIGTDSFICVVVVISSLVRGSSAASPQSQGSVAKILQKVLNTK